MVFLQATPMPLPDLQPDVSLLGVIAWAAQTIFAKPARKPVEAQDDVVEIS